MGWDPRLHAGNVPKDSESPMPNLRLYVFQASALLCASHIIKPAEHAVQVNNATQVLHTRYGQMVALLPFSLYKLLQRPYAVNGIRL